MHSAADLKTFLGRRSPSASHPRIPGCPLGLAFFLLFEPWDRDGGGATLKAKTHLVGVGSPGVQTPRLADPVRTSFLKPVLESIVDVKGTFGKKSHDAHTSLTKVLCDQDRR